MVIGDIEVGKTSIIRRYVDNNYIREYKISVNLDFKQKQVHIYQQFQFNVGSLIVHDSPW